MDIEKNLKLFIEGQGKNKGRQATERYASFDFCFNYFQNYKDQGKINELSHTENIQLSCLQLGFYLASWGMLRGSSFLLEKSVKFYEPLIIGISEFDTAIWDIDIDNYSNENIEILLACKNMIVEKLGNNNKASDTLVTKIMLGVFGNVPAYDDFFRKGFKIHSFGKKSLKQISQYYLQNNEMIDNAVIYTFDYYSGLPTNRKYTKAKVVDMIGFMQGIGIGRKNKKNLTPPTFI